MKLRKKILTALVLFFYSGLAHAVETNDSVDVYQNQTVTNQVVVQGRTVLSTNNVTVTSTGDLKMFSPDGINVTGPFIVEFGGVLELNGGLQYAIRYSYDATGNRTKRQRNN